MSEYVKNPEKRVNQDSFIIHSGNDRIGGIAIQVIGSSGNVFLDFGALMDVAGRYFGLYDNLSYSAGLRPLLALGALPPIPGIYRDDIPNHPTLEELINTWKKSKRHNEAELRKLINSVGYLGGLSFPAAVLTTHYHWDHCGNIGFLKPSIPIATQKLTFEIIQAMENHWGGDWRKEVTHYRVRNGERKNPLDKINRRFIPLIPLDIYHMDGLEVTIIPVSHSAIGSSAIDVAYKNGKRIHYTGDIRSGIETSFYIDWLKANPPDIFIVDGTNVGSKKAELTEYDVLEKMKNLFEQPGSDFIMIPQRHFQRLKMINEAAKKAGKKVYIPLSLAYYLYQLEVFREYDDRIPPLEDFIVYLNPKNSGHYEVKDYPKVFRNVAFDEYGNKKPNVISLEEIDFENSDSVVVLNTISQLMDFYNFNKFPPYGRYIHSSSEAYDERGLMNIRQIKRVLKEINYPYYYLHASGHFSERELIEFLKIVAGQGRVELIIPIHTENPQRLSELIRSNLETRVLTHIQRSIPYNLQGQPIIRF